MGHLYVLGDLIQSLLYHCEEGLILRKLKFMEDLYFVQGHVVRDVYGLCIICEALQ